jgi:hypothetical protein
MALGPYPQAIFFVLFGVWIVSTSKHIADRCRATTVRSRLGRMATAAT